MNKIYTSGQTTKIALSLYMKSIEIKPDMAFEIWGAVSNMIHKV